MSWTLKSIIEIKPRRYSFLFVHFCIINDITWAHMRAGQWPKSAERLTHLQNWKIILHFNLLYVKNVFPMKNIACSWDSFLILRFQSCRHCHFNKQNESFFLSHNFISYQVFHVFHSFDSCIQNMASVTINRYYQ